MTDPKPAAPASAPGAARRVPVLLELTLTAGKILTVGVTVCVVALSILERCTVLAILLRGGVALLGTGLLAWAAAWIVARGTIEAARGQMLDAQGRRIPPGLSKRA